MVPDAGQPKIPAPKKNDMPKPTTARGIPHASRRRQAVAVLNENYKNILRKFYKQYAPKRRILPRIKVYQRLAQRQWHHLVGGGRN